MKLNPNIDELLNSYIDGELTERQQTEVKRLAANDAQIAKKLRELQKCKLLVGSLPRSEAPAGMVEEIKNSLERKTLLQQQPIQLNQRAGAWDLLARKVLTAAAMIVLIAVLASVIYTIVAPEKTEDTAVVVNKVPAVETDERPEPVVVAAVDEKKGGETSILEDLFVFNGRLELKTNNLIAVDAFINSAVGDNGLWDKVNVSKQDQKSVYTFSCSREALGSMLADLGSIWYRFESAKLVIDTDKFGEQIVVDAVTAEQIDQITEQDNLEDSFRIAKDFAALNDVTVPLPGTEILKAIEGTQENLMAIPRPRLTSGEKTTKKSAAQKEAEKKVNITVVVEGSE